MHNPCQPSLMQEACQPSLMQEACQPAACTIRANFFSVRPKKSLTPEGRMWQPTVGRLPQAKLLARAARELPQAVPAATERQAAGN